MGAFEGLFLMSFSKMQFLQYRIFAQCFPSMHCKQTWHKDCLHCVISQSVVFVCFLYKSNTYISHKLKQHFSFKNSSLECTDHQPTEEHDDSIYPVCAFAAICGQNYM